MRTTFQGWFPMDSLDLFDSWTSHPTFLVQQGHILNIDGDALSGDWVNIGGDALSGDWTLVEMLLVGGWTLMMDHTVTSFIIDMHMISRHDLYTHSMIWIHIWLQSWRKLKLSSFPLEMNWLLYYRVGCIIVWQVLPGELTHSLGYEQAGWQNRMGLSSFSSTN